MEIRFDCKHFLGHVPCKPNKLRGKVCSTCDEYKRFDSKILIIKLGAIGDVIRTTPLVKRFRELWPDCHITWITHSPEVLPREEINRVIPFEYVPLIGVLNEEYDIAINLDKELEALVLLRDVRSKKKYGFVLNNGHIDAATPAANHKLITGLFDEVSRLNTKNYLEEIFEICDLEFNGEGYLINLDKRHADKWRSIRHLASGKQIVALNTGCGERWRTRLWPMENWIDLISMLNAEGFFPMVVGGKDEHELNTMYASQTGCYYPGHHSLAEFVAITSHCDIVVSPVSLMMHIAIALEKTLLLFNNIFNRNEFELYGRGEIIEPTSGCDCYYGNACTRQRHCMNDISPELVMSKIRLHASNIAR